jgi:hypothetical protein
MARKKKISIEEELKNIEAEERLIEKEERSIEEKEDLIRVFEELGLMRWKSYYILTAGAILLLALTFVTSLWVMHDQLVTLQDSVDQLATEVSMVEGKIGTTAPAAQEWCPAGQKMNIDLAGVGTTEINIVKKEMHNNAEMCYGLIKSTDENGTESTMQIWWDELGNMDIQ